MKTKTTLIALVPAICHLPVLACDLCQENQPTGLKNITHGAGPSGNLDFVIIWSAALLTVVVLYFSVKFLLQPKEHSPGHIKNIVWNENFADHGR